MFGEYGFSNSTELDSSRWCRRTAVQPLNRTFQRQAPSRRRRILYCQKTLRRNLRRRDSGTLRSDLEAGRHTDDATEAAMFSDTVNSSKLSDRRDEAVGVCSSASDCRVSTTLSGDDTEASERGPSTSSTCLSRRVRPAHGRQWKRRPSLACRGLDRGNVLAYKRRFDGLPVTPVESRVESQHHDIGMPALH
jgi:hypothetical protein